MPIIASLKAQVESPEHQRQDDDRQKGVRDEDREIDDADRSLPGKSDGADVRVISEVGGEKERGRRRGRKHQRSVPLDLQSADRAISQEE